MDTSRRHVPVLLNSVLELAQLELGMHVIDATLGGGGYTRALLERVGPTGSVMAFDWDEQAIQSFREEAAHDPMLMQALEEGRLVLVHRPYSELDQALADAHWDKVEVVVADLGLSSVQLDDPKRGLSFLTDGPLDMRLNSRETVTAADIINQWDEDSLAELFRVYGDEGEALRIAQAIVKARTKQSFSTTLELAELVKGNVVSARRRGRIHPATKVFQALRIAVNSERQELVTFLQKAFALLAPGGRLLIVTFHSGEDVLVKEFFRERMREGRGVLLTKKPVSPSDEEIHANPRSRSGKLRGIQTVS